MPPRSRSRTRTRSPPSRSPSPRRHRRRRSRSREHRRRDDRDYRRRDRDRDYDRRDRRERRRHRTRSRDRSTPPPPRPSSAKEAADTIAVPEPAVVNNGAPAAVVTKPSTSFVLPEEIKTEFLSILGNDEFNFAQSEVVMKWLGDKVHEMVEAKLGNIDEVVRERVAKEKIDIEARLRVQIQQEMREEMDAAQKRQEESQARCTALEQQLNQKIKELEEAQRLAQEERLEMLASRSRLDKERMEMEKERKKLAANEQQTILNTGGIRAPIKLKFGGK